MHSYRAGLSALLNFLVFVYYTKVNYTRPIAYYDHRHHHYILLLPTRRAGSRRLWIWGRDGNRTEEEPSTMGSLSTDIHRTYLHCAIKYKKAQLTQGLRATAPSFQDGRQPPSWILSNRK